MWANLRTTLILACVWRAAAAAAAALGPIGVQSHSYNDFRQWPQALAKAEASARAASAAASPDSFAAPILLMLKLDPQYQPESACTKFSRARPDPRGCLAFNHDTFAANARAGFNTSDDFVAYIADPALSRYLRGEANITLAISLCFKGCGGSGCPCNGATNPTTANWLSLVDDFVAAINAAKAALNLTSLEMLLDGDGNPVAAAGGCLAQRWRPWNSVFISGGDPDASFTSNNATLGYDRLTTFNDPQGTSFSIAAALGFGKFAGLGVSGRGDTPYINWEPSDAKGIATAVGQYAGSPGAPNPAGLRFAINIDAAQLDVYAAAASVAVSTANTVPIPTGGWNARVASGGVHPVLVSLPFQGRSALMSAWEVAGAPGPNLTIAYDIRWYTALGVNFTHAGNGTLPVHGVLRAAAACDARTWGLSPLPLANGSLALVFTSYAPTTLSNGTVLANVSEQVLELKVSDGGNVRGSSSSGAHVSVVLAASPSTPPGAPQVQLPSACAPLATSVINCGAGAAGGAAPPTVDSACRLWAWASPAAGCLIEGALFGGPAASPFSLGAPSLCLAHTPDPASPLFPALRSADLDSVSIGGGPYALPGDTNTVTNAAYALAGNNNKTANSASRVGAALSYAGSGWVLGATMCAEDAAAGGGVGVNDASCWGSSSSGSSSSWSSSVGGGGAVRSIMTAPLLSHVGSHSSLQVASSSTAAAGLLVLEVHSNASCPNSEINNKRDDIGLCDQVPTWSSKTPYLAYNYGSMREWGRQLLSAIALAGPWNISNGPPPTPAKLPSPWPGASPCDLTVAHGSVGQGLRPAAAIAPLTTVTPLPPPPPAAEEAPVADRPMPSAAAAAAAAAAVVTDPVFAAVMLVEEVEGSGTLPDPQQCGGPLPAARGANVLALLGWRMAALE